MCLQQVQQEREAAEALAGQAAMEDKELMKDQALTFEQAKSEGGCKTEHI